jgi:hypothetical protein
MDADLYLTLVRLEAKVDRLLAPPQAPVVSFKEAMQLCGCKSRSSLQRMLAKLQVRNVSRGKYRRQDITNALARIVYAKNTRGEGDRILEAQTEGRAVPPEKNFHD